MRNHLNFEGFQAMEDIDESDSLMSQDEDIDEDKIPGFLFTELNSTENYLVTVDGSLTYQTFIESVCKQYSCQQDDIGFCTSHNSSS